MYKLIELFKNYSKKTVRNLSIFIYKAFQLRQNTIYIDRLLSIYFIFLVLKSIFV